MLTPSTAKVSSDCVTAGFPIFYDMAHVVPENTDIDAAPLVPTAIEGVMGNLVIDNQSCNDIVAEVEFWSSNSDCESCPKAEPPVLLVKTINIPANKKWNSEGVGYFVDYKITSADLFMIDGCVVVTGARQTSACCKWTGVTTGTNGLTVPTI